MNCLFNYELNYIVGSEPDPDEGGAPCWEVWIVSDRVVYNVGEVQCYKTCTDSTPVTSLS